MAILRSLKSGGELERKLFLFLSEGGEDEVVDLLLGGEEEEEVTTMSFHALVRALQTSSHIACVRLELGRTLAIIRFVACCERVSLLDAAS